MGKNKTTVFERAYKKNWSWYFYSKSIRICCKRIKNYPTQMRKTINQNFLQTKNKVSYFTYNEGKRIYRLVLKSISKNSYSKQIRTTEQKNIKIVYQTSNFCQSTENKTFLFN